MVRRNTPVRRSSISETPFRQNRIVESPRKDVGFQRNSLRQSTESIPVWVDKSKLFDSSLEVVVPAEGQSTKIQPHLESILPESEPDSSTESVIEYSYNVKIPPDAEIVRVVSLSANLRESPAVKSKTKQKMKYGDLLIKIEGNGDWIKVQTLDSGYVGYIFVDLVQ